MKNREKTKLEANIYKDIQAEIYKYYDSEGIEYRYSEDPEKTLEDFFSYLYRQIPAIRRNVHYSKELFCKIKSQDISEEHVAILKQYENAFQSGKDMNCFLSNNSNKIQEPDLLLYTWNLFHLHMSGKFVEDKKKMKNNRSNTQLLCIIKPNDVYFVDVIPHPKKAQDYFNLQHLKIIVNNDWMRIVGFSEIEMIPGTLKPKITEDKDIFNLYSKLAANVAFEFQEKGYISSEPICGNRRPYLVMNKVRNINKKIHQFNDVEGIYMGFKLRSDENGVLKGLIKFKISAGKIETYNIF